MRVSFLIVVPFWVSLLQGAQGFYPCNCACCITQDTGEGAVRWGREAEEGKATYGCGPIYYGQTFIHEGFAACESMLGKECQYCERQRQDQIIATAPAYTNRGNVEGSIEPPDFSGTSMGGEPVDLTRFCFYECMPSFPNMDDVGIGGECIPATKDALDAAGVLKANNKDKGPGMMNGQDLANTLGNGADLAKGNFGLKKEFLQRQLSLGNSTMVS